MKRQLTPISKMMAGGLAIALGWLLFEGCECDKEDAHPASWVACIDGKPTRMRYSGDLPVPLENASFDASKWDCSHPESPAYQNSLDSPYPVASPIGGKSAQRAAGPSAAASYPLPQLRELPFLPSINLPGNTQNCDPAAPDVLQTVHTKALVTRASTCPFQIVASIPVATRPLQIAITPDGSTALVTSFDNAVNFINLGSNQVFFTLQTDSSFNPHGIAISPDGSKAYVTNFNTTDPGLAVIDLNTRKIVGTLNTDAFPQGANLSPDGSQLWITYPFGQAVDVIDTLTTTYITRLGIGQSTGIAFNSTGTRAFITSGARNSVVAVDASTFKTLTSYPVGASPTDIKMSYGDEYLVVNNSLGNSISVIDLVRNKTTTTNVNGVPSGISFVQ